MGVDYGVGVARWQEEEMLVMDSVGAASPDKSRGEKQVMICSKASRRLGGVKARNWP